MIGTVGSDRPGPDMIGAIGSYCPRTNMVGTVRGYGRSANMIRTIRSHCLRLSRPGTGHHYSGRDSNYHA